MRAEPGATLESFWEAFYEDEARWSGNPNALLVEEVERLAPATALDLGCGQGGDAIWLAARGWRVTAVDVSARALASAARNAEAAGVGDRIAWEHHDLGATFPAGSFALVSACFLHSPVEIPRGQILRRAAEAVAPGGTLPIVGHGGAPAGQGHDQPDLPTPEEVLAELDLPPDAWRVRRSEEVARPAGKPGPRFDNVLALERLTPA